MNPRSAVALFGVLLAAMGVIASAQPGPGKTRVQASVEPAFRIAPLVHHFDAPRGKLLSFEFEVEALRKPTSLRIRPVGLRQEENGVIMPDEAAPRPQELRLETPEALELDAGQRATLRGRVRVPRTDSNFHSFGVLVQDLGSPVERQRRDAAPPANAGLGVRFVTQYLLRCDITVTSGRATHVGKLQLPAAELRERGGRPLIRAWVLNPTESPVEFGARAMLVSPRHFSARRPLPLVLPVRATLEGPERHIARILPGSRVRLEGLLDEAVFPGEYELHVELLDGYRTVHKASFPVAVYNGEFPAQDIEIVQVAPGVSVEPGQIELSLGRGGKRYLTATLANSGADEVQVRLVPETPGGEPCEWFVVRPDTLWLAPRQRRKVLIAFGPDRDDARNRYGLLRVEVAGADEIARPNSLTVALMGRADDAPQVEIGKLQWDGREASAFLVRVSNRGPVHVPLTAHLTLTDARGRHRELTAGYGRWLLPGHSEDLRFPIDPPLTAGPWELRGEISAGDAEPVHLREIIRVGNDE